MKNDKPNDDNMKTSPAGRPYKSEADRGTVQIKFNVTPKQAEQLNSKVSQTDLTISAFIRKKIGIR